METLSNYFSQGEIYRDAHFAWTMYPLSKSPNSICYALKESAIDKINNNSNITAVITTSELAPFLNAGKGVVINKSPEEAYYNLHNTLADEKKLNLLETPFISSNVLIASTALIGKRVIIKDGVEISDYAIVEDNTIIEENTFIGHAAIIGARGMQNIVASGKPYKLKYTGGVKIGMNCEILAQAIIQKPYQPFFTVIGNNTKVSVRASVGHGSCIGENSMIAGNVTVAGNVNTGNNLWVGPSSVIADGLTIGNNVHIKLGSVVVGNVSDGQVVSGNFAIEHHKQLKNFSRLKKD